MNLKQVDSIGWRYTVMKKQRSDNYFSNMFIKMTLVTTLLVMVLSLFFYIYFKSYNSKLINRSNEEIMHQVIYNAEQVHTYVRNYAVTLSNNLDAVNLMNGQNLSIYEQLSSMRALDLMLKSNPYIGSFYVYNGQEDMYYIVGSNPLIRRGSDFDPWAATILKKGSTLPKLAPIPRRMPLSETNPEQTMNVFSYVQPEYYLDGGLKSALIFNVNIDILLNQLTLGSFDTLDNKSFWFVSRDGGVMAHTDPKQFLTNAAEIPYVQDIIHSSEKSGYFVTEIDGVQSVVTYAGSDSLQWQLVGVTAYSTIANIAAKVNYITLGIALTMLVVGSYAAFLLAINLYTPVQKLQRFRSSHIFTLKQKSLSDLLLTGFPPKEGEWLHEYGITLDPGRPVAVAVMKIDHYSGFCERYKQSDRALLKYALTNIAGEIMSELHTCEAVDLDEDVVVLILNMEEEGKLSGNGRLELSRSLHQVLESFERYCSLTVSIFVSEAAMNLRDLPYIYKDALDLSNDRLKYGHRCMLFREVQFADSPQSFPIDHPLVEQLLGAIKEGKLEKMEETYARLTELVSKCDYNNIMLVISYISSAVFNQLHVMESNSTISFESGFSEFDRKIKSAETLVEIHEHFHGLFHVITERLGRNKNDRTGLIVAQAYRYIDENYADYALSPHGIAALFNMTPAYLNKLCRDQGARSLSDYLTAVRIENSKQLLGETNLTIDQVIDRIGWENKKYFYTIFKKHVGATPTDYRLKLSLTRLNQS
ncbi:AraC family transcriptional regulator [Paenibacillus periandrae]|uniref:AraC family transcriptional regulator n=1 Tax=Paenibacillus periandrae TaxID=1761741 RepID=UPI001F097996|nr:AraC family transcriptional regulator [Paenibacillus periandrae]